MDNTTLNIEKTIVLVGMMGAGKTTIGRRLAKATGLPFIDTDIEIEKEQGCTIADIFENKGDQGFLDLQKEKVAECLKGDPHILATGGSAFLNEDTRELIAKDAVSVWLKAGLGSLIKRLSSSKNRPLLERGDKKEIISNLIDERYPVYAKADITVQSDRGSHRQIIDEIIKEVNKQ